MTRLTQQTIRAIAGPLEDDIVAEILRLNASEAELEEAVLWLADDAAIADVTRKTARGKIGLLYDILSAEMPEDER